MGVLRCTGLRGALNYAPLRANFLKPLVQYVDSRGGSLVHCAPADRGGIGGRRTGQ